MREEVLNLEPIDISEEAEYHKLMVQEDIKNIEVLIIPQNKEFHIEINKLRDLENEGFI